MSAGPDRETRVSPEVTGQGQTSASVFRLTSGVTTLRDVADTYGVDTVPELARLLRQLRRREARRRGDSELTYRELAARTGWSQAAIGEYFVGKTLPPTDRFDVLVRLLGATPAEQGTLATARDRVEERRRGARAEPNGRSVPRELPAPVYGFTGRAEQLAALDELLRPGGPASVVVSAVAGTAGVGKTALAVHWAHRVADRFPDGQLYMDLRGYDPSEPVRPDQALAAFLRILGVAGPDIPPEVAERAARLRSLLAGRRMLVVLDNAGDAEQVRPLLPGTPSCLVLITSRDSLAGLVARDGARRIDLDVLSPAEAFTLLRTLVGDRVDAEPAAAAALAEHCGRLPLALWLVAEMAIGRPDVALAALADDLRGEQHRLDALDASGDRRTAVRAVFSWSYRHLSAAAARAFALLGRHPGRTFDGYAVAALVDTDVADARRLLDELVRAHLLVEQSGRYGMHDLLRAYAAERAESDVDDAGAAVTRLCDYYLSTAAAAVDGPDETLEWLEAELYNLVAAAAVDGCGVRLSQVLWRYLDSHAHYAQALAIHTAGAAAGDPACLTNLGIVCWRLGKHAEAITHLRRALDLLRDSDDHDGRARVLGNLANVYDHLGRYSEALDSNQLALDVYRRIGDRQREGVALGSIGVLYARLGRHVEAAEHQRQAAAIGREVGDRRIETYAVANLGDVYERLGRYDDALDHLEQALKNSREIGDRRAEGELLTALGAIHRRQDRVADALDNLEQALALGREIGDRRLEVETLNTLGETLRTVAETEQAVTHHQAALTLARQTGHQYEHARALDGIAHVLDDTGKRARARELWREALAIFESLDVPEAARVRARLDP